jgi:hypothetical protein
MVLSIGDIPYKHDAKQVLLDYFTTNNVPHVFIEEVPENVKYAHPSWYKLLSHQLLPGYDFIICWDLDLLPTSRNVKFIDDYDMKKLCMCYDTSVVIYPNHKHFTPSFKYNGGLIGIPKSIAPFTEGVFQRHAPGTYPSYEQYYFNDDIELFKIQVHRLPNDLNYLYCIPLGIPHRTDEFNSARFKHYTMQTKGEEKVLLIRNHRWNYFYGVS